MPPSPPAILITGASSGLGAAFLAHYASANPNTPIHAIDIAPLSLVPITSHPNVTAHVVDITSESALASLTQDLGDTPISLLIHCAGIRGLVPEVTAKRRDDPGAVAAAETWEVMNKNTMMRTVEVNTWGAFNVIRSFLPNLQKAASILSAAPTQPSSPSASSPPKVVVLASRMGSLAANSSGGGYAYRASKAALNAIVRSFSLDEPEVAFCLLHPGRVATGLVGWREEGALGVEECLGGCLGVVERVGKGGKEEIKSGSFVDRFGSRIEW